MTSTQKQMLRDITATPINLAPTSGGFELTSVVGYIIVERCPNGYDMRFKLTCLQNENHIVILEGHQLHSYTARLDALMIPKWEEHKALLEEMLIALR